MRKQQRTAAHRPDPPGLENLAEGDICIFGYCGPRGALQKQEAILRQATIHRDACG